MDLFRLSVTVDSFRRPQKSDESHGRGLNTGVSRCHLLHGTRNPRGRGEMCGGTAVVHM